MDLITNALRIKLETMNRFVDNPLRFLKKVFAEADRENDGFLDQEEFVNLVVRKLNFQQVNKIFPL